jgi:sec-independent protein translocase protein TatA
MPQLGTMELVLILVIVVIIFGVGRLPEIGGAVGKAIREFKTASSGEETKSIEPPTPAEDQPEE